MCSEMSLDIAEFRLKFEANWTLVVRRRPRMGLQIVLPKLVYS